MPLLMREVNPDSIAPKIWC